MVQFKNILCPIDLGASSGHALPYAAAVARWYGSTLTVLHAAPTFDAMPMQTGDLMSPMTIVQPVPREEIVAGIERMVAPFAGSINVSVRAEEGEPTEVIRNRALALPADLIVLGTQARRGLERLLLGSVTESVLYDAPCPVLAVPPGAPSDALSPIEIKRILCPMDFSPSAMQALGFALDLARQADGGVTLLHCVEWLSEQETRETSHFNVPEYRRHLQADAESRLQALVADESRSWAEIETVVSAGRAYHEILKVARDRSIQLIVMGAQGRGGLGLALFGSTTEQVLRRATCPVLTVRGVAPNA